MNFEDKFELYSFDIFDTLITRKVATPKGIFALMQEKLMSDFLHLNLSENFIKNFYNYRINAEYRQRKISENEKDKNDITLDLIYSDLQLNNFLTDFQVNTIKDLEIQLEINNVLPIKENIDIVKRLIENKKRVVLISDMYLPEDVIKKMLATADPILSDIKLYLSSTLGVMKQTKKMFEFVKKQENVEYKKWIHTGDNKLADYKNPKRLGMKANLYEYINLKSIEKHFLKNNPKNTVLQLLLGCSKNLCLSNKNKKVEYKIAVSMIGHILIQYVYWFLENAKNNSISRLYFIARDGYILKMIADEIISSENLQIKTDYIYGSRLAWNCAAQNENNQKLFEQYVKTGFMKYKKFDKYCQMEKEVFCEIVGQEFKNFDKGFTKNKRNRFKNMLLQNVSLLKKIVELNKEKRTICEEYLKSSIDYSDDKFAFVDFDGSGLTQNCLAELMSTFYKEPIKSFYFASTPTQYEAINVKRFYYTRLQIKGMGHLYELFVKAPHGQTLGYEYTEQGYKPILENQKGNVYLGEDFEEGLIDSVRFMQEFKKEFFIDLDNEIVEQVLAFAMNDLPKDVADCLGAITASKEGKENNEFAPKLNVIKALMYLIAKKSKTDSIKISAKRSNFISRKILELRIYLAERRGRVIF